jgi:hypothetical protein
LFSDLVRRQVPVDALLLDTTSAEQLRDYDVVLLPDTRLMTDEEADAIRAYVDGGGTLIASGEASHYDQWGRPRESAALADLLGTGTGPHSFGKGNSWYFAERAMGERASRNPGVEGTSGLYGTGDEEWLKQLLPLIGENSGTPAVVAIDAPDGLELSLRRKGDDLIIHLLDWVDDRELADVTLRINRPGRWKAFYPRGTTPAEVNEGTAPLRIRPFTSHELIVIRPLR